MLKTFLFLECWLAMNGFKVRIFDVKHLLPLLLRIPFILIFPLRLRRALQMLAAPAAAPAPERTVLGLFAVLLLLQFVTCVLGLRGGNLLCREAGRTDPCAHLCFSAGPPNAPAQVLPPDVARLNRTGSNRRLVHLYMFRLNVEKTAAKLCGQLSRCNPPRRGETVTDSG